MSLFNLQFRHGADDQHLVYELFPTQEVQNFDELVFKTKWTDIKVETFWNPFQIASQSTFFVDMVSVICGSDM